MNTKQRQQKRKTIAQQIRDLKKKTGLDAKTLRKMFPTLEETRNQKLRGIKRKTKERKKQCPQPKQKSS